MGRVNEKEKNLEIQQSKYVLSQNQEDYNQIMMKKKIMNKCLKKGNIERAEQILKEDDSPNNYIQTILMKGYTMKKDITKAYDLLKQMEQSSQKPYTVTYNTCLQCAFKSRQPEIAHEIFDSIPVKDVISYTTYIKGLFKSNQYEEAIQVHENFYRNTDIVLDQIYYNIVLDGLCQNSQYDYALQLFLEMKQKNTIISDVTKTIVLKIFRKLGRDSFEDIFSNYDENDRELYNELIFALLKKHSTLEKACDILKQTMNHNIILKRPSYEEAVDQLNNVQVKGLFKNSLNQNFCAETIEKIQQFVKRNEIKLNNKVLNIIAQNQVSEILDNLQTAKKSLIQRY